MSNHRLDRTASKAQTAAEAADHAAYYKQLSWQEQLQIAAYLNSKASIARKECRHAWRERPFQ